MFVDTYLDMSSRVPTGIDVLPKGTHTIAIMVLFVLTYRFPTGTLTSSCPEIGIKKTRTVESRSTSTSLNK